MQVLQFYSDHGSSSSRSSFDLLGEPPNKLARDILIESLLFCFNTVFYHLTSHIMSFSLSHTLLLLYFTMLVFYYRLTTLYCSLGRYTREISTSCICLLSQLISNLSAHVTRKPDYCTLPYYTVRIFSNCSFLDIPLGGNDRHNSNSEMPTRAALFFGLSYVATGWSAILLSLHQNPLFYFSFGVDQRGNLNSCISDYAPWNYLPSLSIFISWIFLNTT